MHVTKELVANCGSIEWQVLVFTNGPINLVFLYISHLSWCRIWFVLLNGFSFFFVVLIVEEDDGC